MLLTLALGENVGVEIVLSPGATRRQEAEHPPVHRGQCVHSQRQRGLGEGGFHVREVKAERFLPVQLQNLISSIQT